MTTVKRLPILKFNASTRIRYLLPQACHVRLEIFNIMGQKVVDLVDGPRSAGHHTVFWDDTDGKGRELAFGVYLYRLNADGYHSIRKMLLLQ